MRHLMVSAILGMALVRVVSAQTTPAQPRFGIVGGIVLADVGGDDLPSTSHKAGFVGGITAAMPIGSGFSFQPELVYAMKGTKTDSGGIDFSVKLNYLELPLLVRYDVPVTGSTRPFLLAGPALAVQTSCKFAASEQGATVSVGCDDALNSGGPQNIQSQTFDFGAMFGGGLAFDVSGRAMTIGVRYNLGLTKAFSNTEMKNRALSFVGTFEWPMKRK